MSTLLLPIKPEPDPHAELFCEECGGEVEAQHAVQCSRCEMDFHEGCFWSVEYEICLDCLLLDYERLKNLERT